MVLALIALLILTCSVDGADTLDVTFRYVPRPGESFVRVFVPGTMPEDPGQHWGPNNSSYISPSAPSLMNYDESIDAYVRTYPLSVGKNYEYKFHFHYNDSGTQMAWISDPLNPVTAGPYNNSVVTVSDPLFFQPARHMNEAGLVDGLSVGIFTTGTVESVTYAVGEDTLDGTAGLNSDGVFYIPISPPRTLFDGYEIVATIDGTEHIIYSRPAVTISEAPRPSDTNVGLNLRGGEATFVVHAPSQPAIFLLVGTLTAELDEVDPVVMTKASGEENVWWTHMTLPEGQYHYSYVLMDGRYVGDPFAKRVVKGLPVFIVGSGGVTTADDYSWQSDNYERPSLDSLIIYELHVDDFSAAGSSRGKFSYLIDRLDHLKHVGINAIELMPITEFPGTRSWGYNPQYHLAVEAAYGSPLGFKEFVDEAHSHGIAVILDMVFNHMDSSSPLWQMQPDFNLNPYFKSDRDPPRPNETPGSWGGRDMDHFTETTQDYISAVLQFWVEEYRIDGFRFDYTRGIGWDLDQPESGILGWSTRLKEVAPGVYQIAEHLPASPYLIKNSDLHAGWDDSFHDKLLADIKRPLPSMMEVSQQVLGLYEYTNSGPNHYQDRSEAVKATVTHDEQSFIQEMVVFEGIPLEIALKRDRFYNVLLFTSLGIPMLWQGQELGMQSGWLDGDEEKLSYRPMDWSLLNTERGQRHLEHTRKLIRLRKRNCALTYGKLYTLGLYEGERVIVYGYRDERDIGCGDEVMVVANFSAMDTTLQNVPWLSDGIWFDVINDVQITVSGTTLTSMEVPAYTALVYANSRDVAVDNEPHEVPATFVLYPSFPNPFNATTTIRYDLPEAGNVTIVVYDILGRAVALLTDGLVKSGRHQMTWDGRNQIGEPLPSGVYFYVLTTQNHTYTHKLLLLK